jgi:hypothetical protein
MLIRFLEGGGAETEFRGFRATITPHPTIFTHEGSLVATDDGFGDDDDGINVGEIVIDDACQTDHADFPGGGYSIVPSIAPGSEAAAQNCRVGSPGRFGQSITGGEGAVAVINFTVFCTTAPAPPPASAASTAGGAAPAGPAARPPTSPGQPAAPGAPAPQAGPGAPAAEVPPVFEVELIETVVFVDVPGPRVMEVRATGGEEVPPVTSVGSAFARFTFDEDARSLEYFVTMFGFSPDQVTAAHIHRGAAGVNGPIMHFISDTGFVQASGTISLSDADIADLKAGNFYLNLHSIEHPGGFARAQMVLPPPQQTAVLQVVEQPRLVSPPKGAGLISPPRTGDGGLLAQP